MRQPQGKNSRVSEQQHIVGKINETTVEVGGGNNFPKHTQRDLDLQLEHAAIIGDTSLAAKYLALGADIHSEFESALRKAARYGHIEMVKYLTRAGADLPDAIGQAAYGGDAKALQQLIKIHHDTTTVQTLRKAFAVIARAEKGRRRKVRRKASPSQRSQRR